MSLVRAALLPLALALLPLAVAAQGEAEVQSAPVVFDHRFGGADGGPGYELRFDARGAGVIHVVLLDHDAPRARGDEAHEPYRIVEPELQDPDDPAKRFFPWLVLQETTPSPWFGGVPGGLDLAAWEVAERRTDLVRFVLRGEGARIEKTYAYDGEGRRDLRIGFRIVRDADDATQGGAERLTLRMSGIGLASPRSDYVLGANPAMAVGSTIAADGTVTLEIGHADGKPNIDYPVLARGGPGALIDFAGNTNRFFGGFLYPADEGAASTLLRADLEKVPYVEQRDMPVFSVPVARYLLSLPVPAAGGEAEFSYRMYLGPKSFRAFDERPVEYGRFDPVMEQALDPGCFCSIPGTRTMARFLLWLLGVLQSVVGNWGFAIVCLTILVRGSLVPLNFRMQKSMRAYGQKMSKLKPKLDALQQRYAKDPQQLKLKMVEFQRENKMIPPIGGCLPMFITIPVFFGLFTALRVSYDLRQQPFFGWIDDLSRADHLFALPFDFLPWFNLLPLVMVGMWWWLQAGTPLPSDPQQRQMMKIMRFMPMLFGVMLYNYASGLMVYMITSSAFGLVEQRITRRLLGPVDPSAAGFGATPMI